MSKKSPKAKSIEETYQKKDPREHILLRPEMYVGSRDIDKVKLYTVNEKTKKMIFDTKEINPALYKIFDEILVNATDRVVESNCDEIRITINKDTGYITVYNNGDTIDIVKHAEHNVWVPELIFGHLMTGTNFNDEEERLAGGMNGLGAKLTAIFSVELILTIVNAEYKKQYVQTFRNNLSIIESPTITKSSKKSYTEITFLPDYAKFNCVGLSNDMEQIFIKRAYDVAGTAAKNIKVYLNNVLIDINGFENYIKCFYSDSEMEKNKIIYKDINERWSVGVVVGADNGYRQISYVNRINTYKGGKHVDEVIDILSEEIIQKISKKNKTLEVKPQMIKDRLNIFINCLLVNPKFDTQTKNKLTTKKEAWEKFGYPCAIDGKFIKEFLDTGIVDTIIEDILSLQDKSLIKALTTKKTTSLTGIDKLHDAKHAGSTQSHKCTLILTEGDSALALAIAALRKIGNDYFGAAPLKGKMLNPRKLKDMTALVKNEEIQNIVKILGLKFGEVYADSKKLRYGNVMIFADQDHDGFHIKGLFLNFIHLYWPSLISIGFVQKLDTPILKLTSKKNVLSFYSIPEFQEWRKKHNDNGYIMKYYKGLGTSTSEEAKEYFDDYDNKVSKYISKDDEVTNSTMELVFGKGLEDERKLWVNTHSHDDYISNTKREIDIKEFCDKELKQFSHSDNIRSIPNVYDGLKPSQRKILHVALLTLKNKEVKVATFCGKVTEDTDYHHGESSLQGAIVNMAQNYCGSNNINLLEPNGQFGTRMLGGNDSAAPRYIFTSLNPLSEYIFIAEDSQILEYEYADNDRIEPKNFYPIIPMLLVNGCTGIGTGYSTTIPQFNPVELVECIKAYLNNVEMPDIVPWYRGYKGLIEKKVKKDVVNYDVYGIYNIVDETTVNIVEIPINKKVTDYQDFLNSITVPQNTKKEENGEDKILERNKLNIEKDSNDDDINFTVVFKHGLLQRELKSDSLIKTLKLSSTIAISNMYCQKNGIVTKYASQHELINDFCGKRLEIYKIRIEYIIRRLENQLQILLYKKKYIDDILNKRIFIERKKKIQVIEQLQNLEYPELTEKMDEKESYEYLFKFDLLALTEEKINDLMEKYNEAEKELNYYKNITPKELWLKELNVFLEKYDEYLDRLNKNPNKKTKKPKKTSDKKTSDKKTPKVDTTNTDDNKTSNTEMTDVVDKKTSKAKTTDVIDKKSSKVKTTDVVDKQITNVIDKKTSKAKTTDDVVDVVDKVKKVKKSKKDD